ncbi:MAG: type 1 glutamine amidotransferase domain-containing protein [Leptospirales bacterium]|nr:type 1 glutamine amidotransferase domain-containing protein [Leptospirales bacterium]
MKIIMPMATADFDPSEASIAWKLLTRAGVEVQFATADGKPGAGDQRMLDGNGLGVWKKILIARQDAIDAYNEMVASPAYLKPLLYSKLRVADFDGLMLHGGHAPGVKQYLESTELQSFVAKFIESGKPTGAICHGVLLAARSKGADGRSVLYGRKCTCLLRSQEMAAYNMTRAWLGTYYRTYPETTTQDEVMSFLRDPSDFQEGPKPLFRDSETKLGRGFTVLDGNLLTARWPGDAYNYGLQYLKLLGKESKAPAAAAK